MYVLSAKLILEHPKCEQIFRCNRNISLFSIVLHFKLCISNNSRSKSKFFYWIFSSYFDSVHDFFSVFFFSLLKAIAKRKEDLSLLPLGTKKGLIVAIAIFGRGKHKEKKSRIDNKKIKQKSVLTPQNRERC